MNIEDRIKAIKEKRDQQVIEKAKAESRLEQLKKEEEDIIKKCKSLNIDHTKLDDLVNETNTKLESLVAEAEQILKGDTVNSESENIAAESFPF